MHSILAGVTKAPEFALDKTEASELAKGIANVARHYDVSASAKSVDIAALLMVAGTIYGTRFVAFRMRRQKERQQKASEGMNEPPFPFAAVS